MVQIGQRVPLFGKRQMSERVPDGISKQVIEKDERTESQPEQEMTKLVGCTEDHPSQQY